MSNKVVAKSSQEDLSYWKLRGICIILSTALILASYLVGYSMDLPLTHAREIVRDYSAYVDALKDLQNIDFRAFRFFLDSYATMLACNAPFLGPIFSAYTAYSSGMLNKACLIVEEQAASRNWNFPEFLDYLEWITFVIATSEGVLLTYLSATRRKMVLRETLLSLILQASLTFLAASIFSTSI